MAVESEVDLLSSNIDDVTLFERQSVVNELFLQLIFSASGLSGEKYPITSLDLRTLAGGLSDEQFLSAAAIHLRVPAKILAEDGLSNKDRETHDSAYRRINKALARSAVFIREEMNFPLRASIARSRVDSSASLLALLKKATLFRGGSNDAFNTHLEHCILLKGALAAAEMETRNVGDLEKEAYYLESIITQPHPHNDYSPLIEQSAGSRRADEIEGTLRSVKEPCDVSFLVRDKTEASQMRKYAAKPRASAAEAEKDELGCRFKLDGRQLGTVAEVLNFFRNEFQADPQMIANKGVVSQREFRALYESLQEIRSGRNLKVDPELNSKSDPDYACLQITGALKVPPGGDLEVKPAKWRNRHFELQFVDMARKPPTGFASDPVYELKKDVVIATRWLGSFSETWFLNQAWNASQDPDTGMGAEQILAGLVDRGYIFKKPLTRYLASRNKYAATDVWVNWLHWPGFVSDPIRSRVAEILKVATQRRQQEKKRKTGLG